MFLISHIRSPFFTLPLGADGADVDMPRVTDHYRHLGSEVTGRVDHSALRARVEARVSTLLRMVGRLGGAQLAQLRQCLLTVVRGVSSGTCRPPSPSATPAMQSWTRPRPSQSRVRGQAT